MAVRRFDLPRDARFTDLGLLDQNYYINPPLPANRERGLLNPQSSILYPGL